MARVHFRIEGMRELEKSLKRLGDVPQKHVTGVSRKAMNIAHKQAKATAPYLTGDLQKGIKLVGEKARPKGRKVYRIVFDRAMNETFQKPNKQGKITGYYPVSQEYGFFARNGRYIPGYRFIHASLTDNVGKIEKTIVSEMKIRIDAEIVKGGMR